MQFTQIGNRIKPALVRRARSFVIRDSIKSLFAGAQRPELEQSLLRVLIGGIVLAYLFFDSLRDDRIAKHEFEVLGVATAFFLFSIGLTLQILRSREVSIARRFVGMVADNAATSYCLIQTGETGAVIIGVYLFVTFGNGFRYGRVYLHACQVMNLAGFGLVIGLSEFWRTQVSLSVGLAISIIVLPFYVGVLAQRITEAKRRADEANQAKGRFLANVSHEMRTPLNGVIAMADVLRETVLNDSQREIVDTLGTSAQLLLVQIEDVLDMSKIEAGRVLIEARPFDLASLIAATVKVILPQARHKDLSINTEIAPDAARWFVGDGHHLRQVLLNLVSNAVKFTERGEVLVRAMVANSNTEEHLIRFEVKDTGIGIPASKQAAIFEPFTQADDSITRVYGGTGLGTTIARQLVLLMGGRIGLESTVGVGSVFWFELPLHQGEPAGIDLTLDMASTAKLGTAKAAVTPQLTPNIKKIRGARILVAEDNATNQRVTELILESGGHRVTIVDSGDAALDALERSSFDLAFFDLSMPGVSGLEALKLYRFTTDNPIPVIILSANVTTNIIAQCHEAGAAEFLAKPIRATNLLDAVERHLSSRALEFQSTSQAPRFDDRPLLTVVETPVVDLGVLADLDRLSTDPTFVERLVRGFRSDAERLVAAISTALAARKYEEVKDAAHALKGGAGSVGASQLVALARRFEKATHDVLRLKSSAWTEELVRATEAVFAALENHVEEHRRRHTSS